MEARPKCEFCGKSFSTDGSLKVHINTAKRCISTRKTTTILTKATTPSLPLTTFNCEYCEKTFKQKNHLKVHIVACKSAPVVLKKQQTIEELSVKYELLAKEATVKYELLAKEATVKYELLAKEAACERDILLKELYKTTEELNTVKIELEQEKDHNDFLEKSVNDHKNNNQLILLELAHNKGQIEVFKTAGPTIKNTVTNYIHPKLSKIPIDNIKPLTIEYIQEEKYKFTFEHFKLGVEGIAKFMISLVVVYDKKNLTLPPNRNYVCTDVSRHKCYKLEESKEWSPDIEDESLHKILDEIDSQTRKYWDTLIEMEKTESIDELRWAVGELKGKLIKQYFGIIFPTGPERKQLILDIRQCLKKSINV